MHLQIWSSPLSPAKTYRFATPTLKQLSVSRFFGRPLQSKYKKSSAVHTRLFHTYFIFQFEEDWLINKEVYVFL